MSWTGPAELKAQLARLWERGELLRESSFPLRLTLKTPGSTDITDRFDAVRAWVAELSAHKLLRLEWQEVRHRVQGAQRLPASAWIDSLDDALGWLGKRREAARFAGLRSITRQVRPELSAWLEKRPLQALQLAEEWPLLLAAVAWVIEHPRPGIYLRQMDLPGVHTKFIETHRAVLSELLDLALPPEAIDRSSSGLAGFARRYGFLEKPTRVRFRVLDPETLCLDGPRSPDISLDADSFAALKIDVARVFITENETNFLAFPQVPASLVVFGAGYGWEALARCRWLNQCTVHYWGDIDTHGFAILNQLRSQFAHVESFLMDRETLHVHTAAWGLEDRPSRADLQWLRADESALYDDLRDNRLQVGLRLEQERVGYGWLSGRLGLLLSSQSQT